MCTWNNKYMVPTMAVWPDYILCAFCALHPFLYDDDDDDDDDDDGGDENDNNKLK